MKRIYDFYGDSGHGWLAVPVKELHQLGIADKISRFSYRRGDTAYLEEDQDAETFVQARGENEIEIRPHYAERRSRIRGYASYKPDLDTAPKSGTMLEVKRVQARPDALGEHLTTGFAHFQVDLWRNGEAMTTYLSANAQLAHKVTELDFDAFVAAARRVAHLAFLSQKQIQGTYFCDQERAERIRAQARQVSRDLARLFPEEVITEVRDAA